MEQTQNKNGVNEVSGSSHLADEMKEQEERKKTMRGKERRRI